LYEPSLHLIHRYTKHTEQDDNACHACGAEELKKVGYILEIIRRRAQDSREDECKYCTQTNWQESLDVFMK
jgi:hypothetical protein